MKTQSNFKYSKNDINAAIAELNVRPATMVGVRDSLQKTLLMLEDMYDKHIFYLSYWKDDAPYYGWEWSKDDGTMQNMAKVTDGITQCFKAAYAYCLAGLGETLE